MDKTYEQLSLSNDNLKEYIEMLEEKLGDTEEKYYDLQENYFELQDKYDTLVECLSIVKRNNDELYSLLVENNLLDELEENDI